MGCQLSEKELLKKICDLVIASGVCPEIMPLEWMRRLIYMHRRRWLYCSVKGTEVLAVVGAYRIPEWNDQTADRMPECDSGDILYIPFVAGEGKVNIALLRLLRYCLRENHGVREVIYYKKNFAFDRCHYQLRKKETKRLEIASPQFAVCA